MLLSFPLIAAISILTGTILGLIASYLTKSSNPPPSHPLTHLLHLFHHILYSLLSPSYPMDTTQPTALSLTHILYHPHDPFSVICAYLALTPQLLFTTYLTLLYSSREAEIILQFAGQIASEILNYLLKRYIKEDRPSKLLGKGYGMPSSHAQFVGFFSVSVGLFLCLRHQAGGRRTGYAPASLAQRIAVSVLALACAVAVAVSRVYLGYHTTKQVMVGFVAGTGFAMGWFGFTMWLRWAGWVDWALDLSVARMLRVRDLILTEDLQDAGWGRFEERRAKRRNLPAPETLPNGVAGRVAEVKTKAT